jgi:hypothetical protein
MEYSLRHNIGAEDDRKTALLRASQHILKEAGLRQFSIVKFPEHRLGSAICFAVANNKTREGLMKATPERIERLKGAVGLTEPPKWHELD